jgi:hypothetical protein
MLRTCNTQCNLLTGIIFLAGFTHSSQPGSIDLNSVRLCFQVFLEGPDRGQFKQPLKAVVSEAIYDKSEFEGYWNF